MPANLTVNHLAKSYPDAAGGRKTIIEDFTFHVPKGSFVTILGGNGCGKSTLLRCLCGMEEPDSGEILINGQAGSRLGRVGLVSQEINLFSWRTALENAAFGLEVQGMPRARRLELATAYLKAFGLGDHLHHYPREMSGGQRQKTAIARTLVSAPDIILMDEPFSALDYHTRTGLQCFLLQLWAKLRETILFVTHEVEEAVFLSDYILVINPIPSSIKEIVKVDLPRPRIRTSPEVMELSAKVLTLYGAGSCLGDMELRKALEILARHKQERESEVL
ncbi:MAG: ABC transporter ATP-binding protein [Desulfovibrio sp.]|nr:ABC transporter ATP-binding protein [Desulfovibrio sp.]